MRKILFVLFTISILAGCAAPQKVIQGPVFYPALPQRPRLQYLTSISGEQDIGKKQSSFEMFLIGELPSEKVIPRPYDIGSSKDKIYVIDHESDELIIIDLKNKTFDYLQSQMGKFGDPAGIWITADDFKYVTDFKRKTVSVFDNNSKYVKSYGANILDKPLDVAVYGNKVYVCDFNLSQIVVFDKDSGEVVQRIGEVGSEDGQLYKPSHMTLDNEGNLFITDALNFRIQKFDPFGNFIMKYGYHGDTVGGFARPKGVAIDDEDHLYVVDVAFENVQIFDAATGDVLLYFGGFGSNPGEMYLPVAVHVDYANLGYFQKYADKNFRLKYVLYVGNQYGEHKINVYGFGDWIGELPLE